MTGRTYGLVVGFATCGRAVVLRDAIAQLRMQTRPPDQIFVCYTASADIAGVPAADDIVFIQSPAGLPRQRNAILDAAPRSGTLLFLDDDFLVDTRYLEVVERIFKESSDVVLATGTPYADGVSGPGLSVQFARAVIMESAAQAPDFGFVAAPHAYGCNLALRLETARGSAIRFDERLPLYGWSEDVDFSHRLGRFGRIVKMRGARGVHLGVKSGRGSGRRLGYSQVANPLYLRGKGSYSWRRAGGSVARNLAANLIRFIRPEPYIDRRGRLFGNLLAFADLCRGRLQPERVLEL